MARRMIRKQEIREDEFGEAIPLASNDAWVETESQPVAAAVVSWLAVALESVLLLRLVLRLIAANPTNGFVSAVYELSRPFVAPFFGIAGVEMNTGVGAFETATLIAMLAYGLVAYLIVAALDNLSRRHPRY